MPQNSSTHSCPCARPNPTTSGTFRQNAAEKLPPHHVAPVEHLTRALLLTLPHAGFPGPHCIRPVRLLHVLILPLLKLKGYMLLVIFQVAMIQHCVHPELLTLLVARDPSLISYGDRCYDSSLPRPSILWLASPVWSWRSAPYYNLSRNLYWIVPSDPCH